MRPIESNIFKSEHVLLTMQVKKQVKTGHLGRKIYTEMVPESM